jgi:hypothetical protein
MNKRSVKKRKPVKENRKVPARTAPRKPAKASAAKAPATKVSAKITAAKITAAAAKITAAKITVAKATIEANGTAALNMATVSVVQVMARAPTFRSHKYGVGQTVFYTSSPITRPGASGSYKVVRLLPSDGEDYQYRIKNPGEAFERVAKESQLELEH